MRGGVGLDRRIAQIRAKRRDRIEVIYNQLYFDNFYGKRGI